MSEKMPGRGKRAGGGELVKREKRPETGACGGEIPLFDHLHLLDDVQKGVDRDDPFRAKAGGVKGGV